MYDAAKLQLQAANLPSFEFQGRCVVLLTHGERGVGGLRRPVDESNEGGHPFLMRQSRRRRRHQRNNDSLKYESQNNGQSAEHAFIVCEPPAFVAYLPSWERVGMTTQAHSIKQQLSPETPSALGKAYHLLRKSTFVLIDP